jgi:hypothetical protein
MYHAVNRLGLRAFLAASALLVASPAIADAPPITATVVGASPKITAQLRAVEHGPSHARVVVPTFVPARFRLAEVATPKPQRMGDVYSVRYRKDARTFFEIDCTSGGIGSVDDAHELDVRTPLFAKPWQLYYGDGDPGLATASPGRPDRVAKRLISEWRGDGPFYHVYAENMTPNAIAHVVRSLALLR